MADLKARLIKGDKFSAEDVIELQFTYEGVAHSCVNHIEVVSGDTVTHGGGATAETRLHYKSVDTDADGDGVIDYSSMQMHIKQTQKGTSVVKVVSEVIFKEDVDKFNAEAKTWQETYIIETGQYEEVPNEKGELEQKPLLTVKEGAPNSPAYPTATVYKSGNITLEWGDDTFV